MVELSTGKKFEIKPLTVTQRIEIDDEIAAYYYKLGVDTSKQKEVAAAPFSLSIAYKAIQYSVGDVDLTNLEIIELFNQIYDASHLSEIQKKN